MTEKVFTLTEKGNNPRRVEVDREVYQEGNISYDECRLMILGPKGRIYGVVFADTAALVAWAEEILSEYKP